MAKDRNQISLLADISAEWEKDWKGMPSYEHEDLTSWRSIKVHFRNFEDWNAFRKLVGQSLGAHQLSMWYPKADIGRFANIKYIANNPQSPRYPVYIISKGRWESRLTSKALENIGVPYHIVVEPQEYENYAAVISPDKILQLPFSNLGQGSIPARNWVWEHSVAAGAERHWILDDNINGFFRFHRNLKAPVGDGTIFRAAEEFVDRYENIALAGFQYFMFVKRKHGDWPPFVLNTRIYSCILIKNDINYRWRGRYNEDTDLSIRVLKDGWCTVYFNAFLAFKETTMTMKGGNTDELYVDDGRLKMAQSLQEQHPDITTIVEKWGRYQHQVDYRGFRKNRLKMKEELKEDFGGMSFDMMLTSKFPVKEDWADTGPTLEIKSPEREFDPVLMETIIEWCCPPGGTVLDTEENDIREFVTRQMGREYRTEVCEADLVLSIGSIPNGELITNLRPGGWAVGIVDEGAEVAGEYSRTTYEDEGGTRRDIVAYRR